VNPIVLRAKFEWSFPLLRQPTRRYPPIMSSKFRTFLVVSLLLAPLSGIMPACNQADNPKAVPAPPPPAPKPEELALPKKQGKAFDPGANTKYQEAMKRLNQQNQ
jgi:hypothetical protein